MKDLESPESALSKNQRKDLLRRLYRETVAYHKKILGILFLVIISSVLSLVVPLLIGRAVAIIQGKKQISSLEFTVGLTGGILFLNYIISQFSNFQMAKIGETILFDLRSSLFQKMMSISLDFFDRYPTGKLVARLTSDFDAMEDLVQQGLSVLVNNMFLFVAAIIILPIYSWQLFLVIFICLVPLVYLSKWFEDASKSAYLIVRDRISQTLATIQENLSGIKVVQAFAKEDSVMSKFKRHNEEQRRANLNAVSISIRYFPVVEATGVLATGLVIGTGGALAHYKSLSLPEIVAFVLYLGTLFSPITQLAQLFNQFQSAGAALVKIFEIKDTRTSLKVAPHVSRCPESFDIELRNVSFSYHNDARFALRNINLFIPEGTHLALVGPTGAGKSTLAKLIARIFDPREGDIFIGKTNLIEISLSELRKKVILAPQEGFLFEGSIRNNILLFRSDVDDLEKRLESAGLLDVILDRFGSLDVKISQNGEGISAGERQIISVARLAACDPDVIILDEATSNVDLTTENILSQVIKKLAVDKSLITIAHRMKTASSHDKIAVILSGEILEYGSHEELINSQGYYAKMYATWRKNVA